MNQTETRKIRVYGIVQGVGFRPTVSRHAVKNDIHGSVCNKGPYVEIFAQGTKAQVDGFLEDLEKRPPKRAAILKINVEHLDNNPEFDGFEIIESEKTKGEIFVSPDIAICDECKEELYDPNNRRYLHPFINCTCCGPRMTILDALPYDRERTSMKEFPMCPECAEEYNNPESRRFDAQPVCCNDCGPEVYLIGRDERGREAITYTRKVIASGGIAAIKGIGGFHLCCDATNETAVARLRELKRRPMKPFAIMARNMSAARKECQVTEVQEEVLDGHQKPILLLERLDKADSQICPSVAPGNPKIGVMLPYAPVQLLIFDYDDGIQMPDYLVMTSGNTSGAPICRDDNDAIAELSHLCDCMLSHNRKIRIRADDSVMDYYKEEPYMIRRSRGYAPLPVMVSAPWKGQVLAVGGELKNSFCIGVDGRFYLSPYVGDLEDLRTVNALRETIGRLETLLEVEPPVVVSDMHPRYNSTMIAEESGLPVIKVQHHYAHILSCMAENDCQEPVIGVSFDGTGYGMDGTIWGGAVGVLLGKRHKRGLLDLRLCVVLNALVGRDPCKVIRAHPGAARHLNGLLVVIPDIERRRVGKNRLCLQLVRDLRLDELSFDPELRRLRALDTAGGDDNLHALMVARRAGNAFFQHALHILPRELGKTGLRLLFIRRLLLRGRVRKNDRLRAFAFSAAEKEDEQNCDHCHGSSGRKKQRF